MSEMAMLRKVECHGFIRYARSVRKSSAKSVRRAHESSPGGAVSGEQLGKRPW